MKSKIYLLKEIDGWYGFSSLLHNRLVYKIEYSTPNVNVHFIKNCLENIYIFDFYSIYLKTLRTDVDDFIKEYINPNVIKNNILLFTCCDIPSLEYINLIFEKNNNLELISLEDSVWELNKIVNFLIRKNALIFIESIKNENTLIAFVFNNLKREIIKFL